MYSFLAHVKQVTILSPWLPLVVVEKQCQAKVMEEVVVG